MYWFVCIVCHLVRFWCFVWMLVGGCECCCYCVLLYCLFGGVCWWVLCVVCLCYLDFVMVRRCGFSCCVLIWVLVLALWFEFGYCVLVYASWLVVF